MPVCPLWSSDNHDAAIPRLVKARFSARTAFAPSLAGRSAHHRPYHPFADGGDRAGHGNGAAHHRPRRGGLRINHPARQENLWRQPYAKSAAAHGRWAA